MPSRLWPSSSFPRPFISSPLACPYLSWPIPVSVSPVSSRLFGATFLCSTILHLTLHLHLRLQLQSRVSKSPRLREQSTLSGSWHIELTACPRGFFFLTQVHARDYEPSPHITLLSIDSNSRRSPSTRHGIGNSIETQLTSLDTAHPVITQSAAHIALPLLQWYLQSQAKSEFGSLIRA